MTTQAEAQAQLQAAVEKMSDAMDMLDSERWLWGNVPTGISLFHDTSVSVGLFYREKIGQIGHVRGKPHFYLFFNNENVNFQWTVVDAQRKPLSRSFVCAVDAINAVLAMANAYQPKNNDASQQALLDFADAVGVSRKVSVPHPHPHPKPTGQVDLTLSPESPFNDPLPVVVFEGKLFVLSGNFTVAKSKLHQVIIKLGGKVNENVGYSCDYLIVAEKGSDQWAHGSYGRKIDKAIEIRKKGYQLSIISERYFLETCNTD